MLRCGLHFLQHFLELAVVKIPSIGEHTGDLLRIGNVLQRIRAEQHQVSNLAFFHRAKLPLHSKEFRGIESCRLQRFQRSESGSHESLQLFMQTEARKDINAGRSIRSSKKLDT